jgi:glc operon protein GlcG
MNKPSVFTGILAFGVLCAAGVSAEEPPATPASTKPSSPRLAPVPRPTLSQALRALETATTAAKRIGVALSCAVVDVRGDAIALVRMDDAGFLTTTIAEGKAFTSAIFGRPSSEFVQMEAAPFFISVNVAIQNRMVAAQGAVPIVHEGRVIGAVGCSGGAPQQDEAAAKAAAGTF